MAQPYLSLERAKSLLVEVVESSPPGSRNATVSAHGPGCVYLNSQGKRCIVGEMLHRMGMPKPTKESAFAVVGHGYVSKGYMSLATKKFLSDLQGIFDDGKYHTSKAFKITFRLTTWRKGLATARKRGLL